MASFPVDLPSDIQALATKLNIRPPDIQEWFIRGSGHGGQKINKTSSCVLLKHQPTGIEVRCQKHREQSKNRLSAYKLLILKIDEQVRGVQSRRQMQLFRARKQKARRSRKAKAKILAEKHRRSDLKAARRPVESAS